MGSVTNLNEFRNKRSMEHQVRPMTHSEWIHFINSPDAEEISAAIQRCLEIREDLRGPSLGELFSHKRGYLFTTAFRRATLRMELAELVEKYNLVLFEAWV